MSVVYETATAAKYLAGCGNRIFPLPPGSKAAELTDWPNRATTDAAQVAQWWPPQSKNNIAVVGGHGRLILDIDWYKPGCREAVADLEAKYSPLPPTRTVTTPRGGEHRYYLAPDVKNSESEIGTGLDIKSNRGYVVGPWSYASDRFYCVKDNLPIVPAPRWLIDIAGAPKPKPHEAPPGGWDGKLRVATPEQWGDIRSALDYLTTRSEVANNEQWSDIGYTLLCLGNEGRETWCDWSVRAPGYGGPTTPEAWWESHNPERARSDYRHLFTIAQNLGWINPRSRAALPPSPGVVQKLSVEMAALLPVVLAEIRAAARDTLFLSNDHLEPNAAAERIFTYLGAEREMYRRGNAVVELDSDKRLISMSPTMFRSRLNMRGRKVRAFKVDKKGNLFHAPKLCSEDEAKLLLNTSAVERLPEIKLVARMPVLVERDGVLITTKPGYNADCGVLVTSGVSIPTFPLDYAAKVLLELLHDFQFAESGDKARALSGFVAPGLRMGGLLHGDALITSLEANESQAGKGFMLKIVRAIYGEPAYPVAQKEGGVGSFDESLQQGLLSGIPFVNFDNLRGTVRSAYLESIITAGTDRVPVRVPHRGEVQVDITRVSFQLTSNGFQTTRDLSNRLLMVRLLKQPADYAFRQYPEGGLLQRVEKNSAGYLGCVHAVIRHWHAAGKPCLTTEHTFKEWVGTLDWIVQDVWQSVPLLEGHSAAAARVASPSLSWLRQLGFVVIREGKGGQELRTGELRELCERCDLMPDGIKPSWEENAIERAMGRLLGSCFAKGDSLELDSIRVTRVEREEKDSYYVKRETKFYTFQAA
jgi:hypothetical protein